MERNSFVFYKEWKDAIVSLPKDVRLEIYEAIIEYGISGKDPELKQMAKVAFSFIKNEIDKSKYNEPPRGENHWNWKGGITDENHRQRESSDYKRWRMDVFCRDNYTCQHCKQIGGVLNAHHVKPFSVYPELRLDVDNGVTLCRKCHIKLHKIQREWNKK